VTVGVVLALVLTAGILTVRPGARAATTGADAAASAKLCDALPKAQVGMTVNANGLNGPFALAKFASSPASIGSVGVRGLSAADFVAGCASTTTDDGFTSDRFLLRFASQSGALKYAAYALDEIAPALSTYGSPTAPDTMTGVSGSLFEYYDNASGGVGEMAFAVRGTAAAEVVLSAQASFIGDLYSSLQSELSSTERNLTGRSAQVTLGITDPNVSGPVRPVVRDSTSPGTSVDLPEAMTVTRLLWQYRQLALSTGDPKALPLIESGPLLAVDRALCASSCAAEQKIGDVVDYSPIVALQATWPATFVASVVYSGFCGQLCVDTFVVVQQRRGAPWRMSLYVAYSGQDALETSSSGPLTEAGVPSPPPGAPVDFLQADYARYLQSLAVTGRPPSSTPLARNFFTGSQILKDIGIPPDGLDSTHVSRITTTFAAGPLSDAEFAVDFDVTGLCGTYTWTTTVLPLAGQMLTQPADRSSYGPVLVPGTYASIDLHGIGMVCFDISSAENQPINAVGNLAGVVSGTGV
jgi:hypothetical protein